MNPKVSIIIPFYNAMNYLEDCVNSVAAQTLSHIEIILIDDGSTDLSAKIADDFAHTDIRIKVIHQSNSGVSAARNAGLDAATGEYIGFIDADDIAVASMYESLYQTAVEHQVDIVGSGFIKFGVLTDSEIKVDSPLEKEKVLVKQDIIDSAVHMHSSGCFCFIWRFLYSAKLVNGKHIRFDDTIKIGEDTLFCMECFFNAQTAYIISSALYKYRIHPDSVMRRKYKPELTYSLARQYEKKLRMCETFMADKKQEYLYDLSKYNITVLFYQMLKNLYSNNEHINTRKALKELAKSEMIANSFQVFSLNTIRSKSIDWLVYWFVRHKIYTLAHILCRWYLFRAEGNYHE